MSKINNKTINYGLGILAIMIFSLIFIPSNTTQAQAAYGTNIGDYYAGYRPVADNPKPQVSSINPNNGNIGAGAKTVTITGDGFVPSSVARLNGSNRTTTFIDSSHLLIQLNANDMYRTDGFFISVFNGEPGGGYSNAMFFTIKNATAVNSNSNTNTYSDTSSNSNTNTNTETTNGNDNSNYSSLASNAIYGSSGFLPSGLAQWVFLAIVILLIIMLVRRVFGAKENYNEIPMKHS